MKRVHFVCTGNTCRSPMAEELFVLAAKKEGMAIEAESAGIAAFGGQATSSNALNVLSEIGIDRNKSAKRVDEQFMKTADLVFTMTENHKRVLMERYPFASDRIFTLKEYVWDYLRKSQGIHELYGGLDVADPFGGDLETYQETRDELRVLIDELIRSIQADYLI